MQKQANGNHRVNTLGVANLRNLFTSGLHGLLADLRVQIVLQKRAYRSVSPTKVHSAPNLKRRTFLGAQSENEAGGRILQARDTIVRVYVDLSVELAGLHLPNLKEKLHDM